MLVRMTLGYPEREKEKLREIMNGGLGSEINGSGLILTPDFGFKFNDFEAFMLLLSSGSSGL